MVQQLQIVPEMTTEWNPGKSKGREYIDKLRADNVVSKWDSKHNRPERTGKTWSEREVDKLDENAWKRAGMTREKTFRRLEKADAAYCAHSPILLRSRPWRAIFPEKAF